MMTMHMVMVMTMLYIMVMHHALGHENAKSSPRNRVGYPEGTNPKAQDAALAESMAHCHYHSGHHCHYLHGSTSLQGAWCIVNTWP